MNAETLKLLLAGEYICPVRYANAFALLQDESEQDAVNEWLRHLGMRLGRLGDDGAFFMAPAAIGAREITQVKNELLRFRDEYGPSVLLLDFIRRADAGGITLSPGEYLVLYRLEAAVSQSTMLEIKLKDLLGVISNAAQRNSNRENLRRLLEQLVKAGYAVLADKDSETYQVTGKVEQLYAVLQFLDENKAIPEAEIDDLHGGEGPGDLADAALSDDGTPP